MSRFPKDIGLAALGALMVHEHKLFESVAEAILAERKRCAAIAKMAADVVPGGALGIKNGPEHQRGCSDAGNWIWTEIMEPVG